MHRLAFAAAVLLVAAAVDAQEFPHKFHVEEQGFGCADCHDGVSESRQASDNLMPDGALCLDCHEEGDVPMEWPAAPRDIFFDHAHHVETLGMECAACHPGLDEEGWREGGYLPGMDGCMTCHNGGAAPRDCEACHSADRASLMPESHTAFWSAEHGPGSQLAGADCMPCHSVTDCQECHDGAQLVEAMQLGGAAQPPYAPQMEGSTGTLLQAVHGLNFRYLHAIEARGKEVECLTCHELDAGDFCAECHNPSGSEGIRPAWHGMAGFAILGVGSGGGRHAEMARQDIENCAACHDSRGDDPVCLQCHMDRTPGRGNDPRTHAAGFADDIGEGDFHDDDGAICFTCHTQTAGAEGFCGYCHAAP
jgi:hypothetical protein